MQDKNLLRNLLKGKSKEEITIIINSLEDEEVEALLYDWQGIWARDSQLTPAELSDARNIWLILAGRGWGKTRTGVEYVRELVRDGYKRIALIGPTPADVRDVMIEGESGIMNTLPEWELPLYEPSKRRLTFPNGAIATVYSGYKPDQLRGPQHDAFWADELAAWQYLQETWDMLMFGLRLGKPRGVITTTPRPSPVIKDLVKADNVIVTKGSTYENRENLADAFFNAIIGKYEGTRLGRQELNAEILDDNPNALWNRKNIDKNRVTKSPDLKRIVVAIDPNASNTEKSDEIGIVAAGVDGEGVGYILGDESMFGSPKEWGSAAITAYHKYKSDRIVAEINQGGNMVEYVIRTIDTDISYKGIHATRGKYTRAEPISALYEQNKVKHVGSFPKLEDEMCEWVPGMESPNRMDALVWALTDLMLEEEGRLKTANKSDYGL